MAATTTESIPAPPPVEKIKVKVDGREIEVPKTMPDWQGKPQPTTMLQACKLAGVDVPHYCYHPKLPDCRQLPHVPGRIRHARPRPGPQAGAQPGRHAQDHPLRAALRTRPPRAARLPAPRPFRPAWRFIPVRPPPGRCARRCSNRCSSTIPWTARFATRPANASCRSIRCEYGQAASRFAEEKVHKPKQVDLGPRIVLDDERCILCSRCIRFTRDIAGDDALGFTERGSHSTLTRFPGKKFDNNYTLNTVDICPVGALTSKDFRFQMRVWFLKESKSLCASCATGCNIVIGSREDKVYRYEPRENDAVNSCWMCDYGRLNYKWINRADRLDRVRGRAGLKLVRRERLGRGRWAPMEISWPARPPAPPPSSLPPGRPTKSFIC